MTNRKKKPQKRLLRKISFEEIDHRLSCGWHADLSHISQRKKYVKGSKKNSKLELDSGC